MKNLIRRKAVKIPLFIIIGVAAIAIFGWVVMYLWNAVLAPATGAGIITFWQALGILVLSRILVGGFGGGDKGHRSSSRRWKEKWTNMSEEEKVKFREEWKRRCGKSFNDWGSGETGPSKPEQ
jgi:Ca2+/H+ antiporter, TMEM165/GDT1 family